MVLTEQQQASQILIFILMEHNRGGFRGGGGGGGGRFPSGIRPPADPNRPPFVLFWDIYFLVTDQKNYLKTHSAPPIYINFEGGARAKKTPVFRPVFFSKFCLRRRNFGQNRVFVMLWESSENQFGRPKKMSTKFLNFFENPPPPPLEKILDPPLEHNIYSKSV